MDSVFRYFPDLTPRQREQFAALGPLYAEWNARINVVSRKDFDQLYLRHVLHSLAIARVCAFAAGARVLDVGCGGGFPSVPLAILFPETRFTAVDSIGKKITVVRAVAEGAGIANLEAPNGILYLKGGDLTDELARTCQTWREYPISAFFDEEFFETKKVVYTSR